MTTVQSLKCQVRRSTNPQSSGAVRSVLGPGSIVAFSLTSILALAYTMSTYSYEVWAVFWIAPLLMLICVPIASHAAQLEDDPMVARFLLAAAFLKIIVGSLTRFIVLHAAYNGGGDSERYHLTGKHLAMQMRHFDYGDVGKISGTRFVELLTGQIYAITGATRLGGFMVFSFLGFIGMYALYRAFCIAIPNGDRRRYRALLFLFPTMWFWPSSLGKEAWMIFTIGIAAYGFALIIDGHLRGLLCAGAALWGAAVVRPHVAAIFLVAAAAGVGARLLAGRGAAFTGRFQKSATAFFLVLMIGASLGIAVLVQDRFDLDRLDAESAESVLVEAERRSGQGGSEFDAPSVNTPSGYAMGVVTVLVRPFPFEATNVQSLASSLEGLLLVVLVGVSIARLSRVPAMTFRIPAVAFAVAFVFTFAYAFASIENFGILVRQRSQVLPFVLLLLSASKPATSNVAYD